MEDCSESDRLEDWEQSQRTDGQGKTE